MKSAPAAEFQLLRVSYIYQLCFPFCAIRILFFTTLEHLNKFWSVVLLSLMQLCHCAPCQSKRFWSFSWRPCCSQHSFGVCGSFRCLNAVTASMMNNGWRLKIPESLQSCVVVLCSHSSMKWGKKWAQYWRHVFPSDIFVTTVWCCFCHLTG